MKASEVLNHYAKGERNFRSAKLRGLSFQGQDLSGADFTEADIRGTNFTNAILRGANFTRAKAGVQKRWLIGQLIIAFLLSVVFEFIGIAFNASFIGQFFSPDWTKDYSNLPGYVLIVFNIALYLIIARQGFTAPAIGSIAIAGAIAVAIAVAVTFTFTFVIAFAAAFAVAVAVASALAFAVAAAVAAAGAFAVTGAVTGAFAAAAAVTRDRAVAGAGTGASTGALAVTALSLYVAWRVRKGDEKFALIRSLGIAFAAIGGTTFHGANLTHANFSQAMLKSTHFMSGWRKDREGKRQQHETRLDWVCWQDAQKLEYARLGKSMLSNPAVRDLLVTRNGYQKTYVDANLRSANLDGVNLEGANLTWADLSGATLRHANLKDADLIETLALHTDFTAATLTGACLEAWNIDSQTKLEHVDCQYVYLLRGQQERRPSSGSFAPGEFTKLFQEALSTVDLIFRSGVDWKAFVTAFKTVQVHNEATELTIQSIENKGDGVVVVRVNVPPETNKAEIHSEFNQQYDLALKALEAKYQGELKAKEGEIALYREQSANMWSAINALASRPINITNDNTLMNNSTDNSQNVNIGGNVTGSTINLGALSGSVSNAVNQLPDAPDHTQPGIKALLVELQAAIESDTNLPDNGKATALENVKVLAEVAQTPEAPEKKNLGNQAITFLKGAVSFLPDTAKLAEASSKLLPLIAKALGLPF
jgi:uncharacterized protein YjbI with pentapeptide repeats